MSPEEARDWLGLKEGASQTEIKKAWKRMLEKNHPDKEINDHARAQATSVSQKINEAKETLTGEREATSSSSRSSSKSQRRNRNTSENTNQKDYSDDYEYQRWREEQRWKSGAGNEEQERRKEEWKKYNTKTGGGKYYSGKNDSVKRGQILLGIIVIISVLFIVNPFSDQSEIKSSSVVNQELSVIEAPVAEQSRSIEEQPVIKQVVVDVPPPVEVIPTIEIVPIRSVVLTGECDSKGYEWGKKSGRSDQGIEEHEVFFGMYEGSCAKSVVVFDLNEIREIEINSLTLTFTDKIGSYGRTCHGDSFWSVSNTRTCLEPKDSELRYVLQDSLSCTSDIFQESENWQNADSWINPSGTTTISLGSIGVGDGRYLCMAFSQKGDDVATENDNYFRIWALGDLIIKATYG